MGPYRLKDRLWELNCGILGLLLSQAAAFVITTALKNVIGKPRPDIVARCQLGDVDLKTYQLATFDMCEQEDHHIIKDGFRSFPSGHSSCMSVLPIHGYFANSTVIQRHLRVSFMRPCTSRESFTYSTVEVKYGRPQSPSSQRSLPA